MNKIRRKNWFMFICNYSEPAKLICKLHKIRVTASPQDFSGAWTGGFVVLIFMQKAPIGNLYSPTGAFL